MGKTAQILKNSESFKTLVSELKIDKSKIIEMPFILTAPVKTEILVEELSKLKDAF